MSEKAEAAQKWAEAKSALESANTAYEAAKLAHANAEAEEFQAWLALEALAGRTREPPKAPPFETGHIRDFSSTFRTNVPDARGSMLQSNHSLKVDPIG